MKRLALVVVALISLLVSSAFATFDGEELVALNEPTIFLSAVADAEKAGEYSLAIYGIGLQGFIAFDVAVEFQSVATVTRVVVNPDFTDAGWIVNRGVTGESYVFVGAAGIPAIPTNDRIQLFRLYFVTEENASSVVVRINGFANDLYLISGNYEVALYRETVVKVTGNGKIRNGAYELRVGQGCNLDVLDYPEFSPEIVITLADENTATGISAEWDANFHADIGTGLHGIYGWGGWINSPQLAWATHVEVEVFAPNMIVKLVDEAGNFTSSPRVIIVPMLGDVDGDGLLSITDAIMILVLPVLSNAQNYASEVSGNGFRSAYDAALVLARMGGLIDRFPVELNEDIVVGAPQKLTRDASSEDLVRQLQKSRPDIIADFVEAGGSLDALKGVTAKDKLATQWGTLKVMR